MALLNVFQIDGQFESIWVGELEGAEHGETPSDSIGDLLCEPQIPEEALDVFGQKLRETGFGGQFTKCREISSPLGQVLEGVEQHRLPHSPKTADDLALLRFPENQAREEDLEALDLLVSPSELTWTAACAGRIGITDRIHLADLA